MKRISFILIMLVGGATSVFAKGPGTSAALFLNESPSARFAALGDAGVAAQDDAAAQALNPASLAGLSQSQGSLLYERGIAENAHAQAYIGFPSHGKAFGLSLAHYSSGDIDIVEYGEKASVNGQTDLAFGASYAWSLGGTKMGVTGKYVSSEIVEQDSADAFAFDAGVQVPVTSRIRLGSSLNNIGTKLNYGGRSVPLPSSARAGAALDFLHGKVNGTLFLDGAYLLNEKELTPAVGLETRFGPLALRAGYTGGRELQKLSLGAGLQFERIGFNYAMGMVDQLDSRQTISVTVKFGH